jgi:O-antigen/teichoic acid export membrane protein
MGVVIRQSIYATIISYAGVAIGYLNLLYLFPKFLEPSQVGLLRVIQDAAILFAPFAQFGLVQSIFKYHPQLAKDKESETRFISAILMMALLGFLLFFLVFRIFQGSIVLYFEDKAADIIEYAGTVLWLTLILVLTAVFESYARSLLLTFVPNLLREVVVRLLLAVMVVVYFQGLISYEYFIYGTVLSYLLCLLSLTVYLVATKKLAFSFDLSLLKSPEFPAMFRYTLLSFAGTAGMIVIGKVDSMMVASINGLAAVAVYTNAFYMATVIEIPKRALSQIAFPLIARAFEKKDWQDIAVIYRKTAINQFIIGSLLLIGIYINLDNIFYLIPKRDVYEAGRWVVVIIGVGKLVDMVFGPSSEIIVLSKYYWFNMVLILLLAAIVIVANNLLIPLYGINGAAMGAALALIIFNSVKYLFIYWKLKIQPFTFATVKVLVIAVSTLAFERLIPNFENIFVDILIRSTLVTIFFGSLVLVSKASPDGNALVTKVVGQLRKWLKP